MEYLEWAEAFIIFAKYIKEHAGVSARDDVVYAGPDPDEVSIEDKVRLETLGWTAGDEECFEKML